MSISIQFLGAAGCVTGSQFLVTAGSRHILVDCGMFQGSPEEVERNRMPFAFDVSTLDAVLLTHAHLDHCGRVPALVRAGFRGPIHATSGTVDLAEIVLRDSAKLQVEWARRWNRHHAEDAEAKAADAESEAKATDLESDDASLPERLRARPPGGRDRDARAALRRARRRGGDAAGARHRLRRRGDDHRRRHRGLPRRGAHPRLGHHRAARGRGRRVPHDRVLGRPRPRRHADPARPDPADPCRLRRRRVDLRQPRARSARRGHRRTGGDDQRGGDRSRACCWFRRSPSGAPRR